LTGLTLFHVQFNDVGDDYWPDYDDMYWRKHDCIWPFDSVYDFDEDMLVIANTMATGVALVDALI
jgi:hypothetical protein